MKNSQLYEKAKSHFQPDVNYTREDILQFLMPNKKPKRAMSPYQLFLADPDVQEKIRADNPDADFGTRSKLLAAKWTEMTDVDKTPYQERASQNAPHKKKKRAPTAYNLYIKDPSMREKIISKNPDAPQKDIMKLLAAEWKNLTDEDKIPYQEESNRLKQSLND